MKAMLLALALAVVSPVAVADVFSAETAGDAMECARNAPIVNVVDRPYANPHNRDPAEVIQNALDRRRYRVTARNPGSIEAFYAARNVRADLTVTYTATTYSITYRDSQNMNYENGRIHPNYNRWVNNLDHDLQADFSALPPVTAAVPAS